jgi:transglutaminase-like putative cysteine protease
MRIAIDHETQYRYDQPASYGVQEVRLTPSDNASQTIVEWNIDMPGFEGAARYVDADGNLVHLVSQLKPRDSLIVRVSGIAETRENGGVTGLMDAGARDQIYVRQTELTQPGQQMRRLASLFNAGADAQVSLFHAIMETIRERMTFDTGQTDAQTTAEEALREGHGVCQDFSHIFIGVCRMLDVPARYVTGYLAMGDGEQEAQAHHAWAEALVAGLGWVGFDAANGICPDARYVRLGGGHDAAGAAPVRGIRRGAGNESLSVKVYAAEQPQ